MELLRAREREFDEIKESELTRKWKNALSNVFSECKAVKPLEWVETEVFFSVDKKSKVPFSIECIKLLFPLYVSGVGNTLTRVERLLAIPSAITTKKGYLQWLLDVEGTELDGWSALTELINDVFTWLRSGSRGVGMPIFVQSKHEPIKLKKIAKGQHRSIQYPFFLVSFIERVFSSWIENTREGLRLRTVDDLMARHDSDHLSTWMAGATNAKVAYFLSKHKGERDYLHSYDVTAWDRSLNRIIIAHLFNTVVRDETLAVAFANGYCGSGSYIVGDSMLAFKSLTTLWCSGINLTLAGNCLMHSSLLRVFRLVGIVQGDDGVLIAPKDTDLNPFFNSVGMKLKQVEVSENFCDFCSEGYHFSNGSCRIIVDIKRQINKAAASGKDFPSALNGILSSLIATTNRMNQEEEIPSDWNATDAASLRATLDGVDFSVSFHDVVLPLLNKLLADH